jgi:hypothetical protein
LAVGGVNRDGPAVVVQELRERAMRLVQEARREDPESSLNAAVIRIGQRRARQ